MDARRARPRGGLLFGDFLLATQEKVTRAPGRRAEKDSDVEFQTEVVTVTSLPAPAKKKLGLVIDLDTCVGCHACAVACKEWNDGGDFGPLADDDPYGAFGLPCSEVLHANVSDSWSKRENVQPPPL